MDNSQSLSKQPLFDSHIHLFRGGYSSTYGDAWANQNEVALYESMCKVHNIERALVIGYEGDAEFAGNNSDLAKWSQQHDWITPLEYFAPENPPNQTHFGIEQSKDFAGIAIFAETVQQAQSLFTWPQPVIKKLNERRAIVSLNTSPEAAGVLHGFIANLEGCFVLISHLGSPGTFCEVPTCAEVLHRLEPIRRLGDMAHVGVKVSGLYAISDPAHDFPHRSVHPFLNQLRDDFGAKRLFWGSDFSPALEHVSFAQTIAAISHLNWPDDEMASIMGLNLKQLLENR